MGMNQNPHIIEDQEKPPFRLTEASIMELIGIHQRHTGIVLSEDEAELMGRRMLQFTKLILS